jgi:glucan-binding YG repeat protein
VRRINKIMALVLVVTSISTITPLGTFSINAKAAVNDNSEININSITNNMILGITDDETAFATVDAAMLTTKLYNKYKNSALASGTVSQFKSCGSISYTLTEAEAEKIATELFNSGNISKIQASLNALGVYAAGLIVSGDTAKVAKGKALASALSIVGKDLQSLASEDSLEIAQTIILIAKDMPVYQYTIINNSGATIGQGFAVGGVLGLALDPSDTYIAAVKSGTYSTAEVFPTLDLTSGGISNEKIDLSDTNKRIICDGVNINVVDSGNNKIYAVNNPVYNMFVTTEGGTPSTDLNIIRFPKEVSNLSGSTTKISLLSEGIEETSILSLSLSVKNGSTTNERSYKYATTIDSFEESIVKSKISQMNISTTVISLVEAKIKANTFLMVPGMVSAINGTIDNVTDKFNNAVSKVNDTIDDINDTIDDLANALDDLTDELKDKNDDIDNAWNKVFDRFDNDEGWGKKDGYTYYYDKDGVSLKGVQKINGKTYYFNRIDGAMETGWQIVDGKKCYFDKKKGYEVFNQWVQDGGDWYFVGDNGEVKKMEWVNDHGKSYYLKADGKMTKDWLKIDDYWYYFNQDGSMVTSTWKWSKDKWYYLKDSGQAATDWLQIGDKWYYFKDPSGELQTGWFRANGNWYCSNNDGSMKTGWAYSKDGWCYLDDNTGIMKKNEWVTVDGKTYYFNINGIMVTGSRYINGTKYVFNSDGTLSV